MKKLRAVFACILMGALLLSMTACGDTPPEKEYPEHYEQYAALLGERRETVLAQLNLTEKDLVSSHRGVYSIPVTAQYNGLTFDMTLEFDEVNDRLWGFYYTKLWENEWDNVIRDVGALAKALTQTFGETRKEAGPNRFSDMSQEELTRSLSRQGGTNYWLIEKRDDPETKAYVDIIREQIGPQRTIADYLDLTLQMEVIADKASGSAMTQLRFELELDYLPIIH